MWNPVGVIDCGPACQEDTLMTRAAKPGPYRGRFAPSPTGELHFGSLVAAMASYLDARANGGTWLVRMEDLDPPREQPGAADAILQGLRRFGFEWDEPVVYQSSRLEVYAATLDQLLTSERAFWCGCSRRHLRGTTVYPGTCAKGLPADREPRSIRLAVAGKVSFQDRWQGVQSQDLITEVGAFIIRRADGLTAYQLAVVIDDAWQQISHVVRGSDLLDSTPRQIFLQQSLGLETPDYAHFPVAVDHKGKKLSKQTFAQPVDPAHPLPALIAAAAFLGQSVIEASSVPAFWAQAISTWCPEQIPPGLTQEFARTSA